MTQHSQKEAFEVIAETLEQMTKNFENIGKILIELRDRVKLLEENKTQC